MSDELRNDADLITPVHIDRAEDDERFAVYEESDGERRLLAWGFATREAAERWVTNHNALSAFSELQLVD
jgi:pyruvate/2-oxoacid:ferredoxin oxidoreductase alpha subunit